MSSTITIAVSPAAAQRGHAAGAPGSEPAQRDEQAGEERRAARHAEVPFASGRADERAEETVRFDARRLERPGLRAEVGDDEDDERAQDCEQRQHLAAFEPAAHPAAASSVRSGSVSRSRGDRHRGERGAGDPEREPGDRILEEAAVEEGVNRE